MSLDKARAAIEAMKELDLDEVGHDGLTPLPTLEQINRLLNIASVQAAIAQADATERMAAALEKIYMSAQLIEHTLRNGGRY